MQFVTLGGVTVGICILVATIFQWFPGFRNLKKHPAKYAGALAPFIIAWCYGCLITLGVGGIIGWLARSARWITNWLGDAALVWGVGGDAQTNASVSTYIPLTRTGGCLVIIITTIIIVMVRKSRYGSDIKMGVWCGICLGTSAGVAGFAAAPIANAVNALGSSLYGIV